MILLFWYNDIVKLVLLMFYVLIILLCLKLCGYNMLMFDVSLIVCYFIVFCVDYGYDCLIDEMKDWCFIDVYVIIYYCLKSCGVCI